MQGPEALEEPSSPTAAEPRKGPASPRPQKEKAGQVRRTLPRMHTETAGYQLAVAAALHAQAGHGDPDGRTGRRVGPPTLRHGRQYATPPTRWRLDPAR